MSTVKFLTRRLHQCVVESTEALAWASSCQLSTSLVSASARIPYFLAGPQIQLPMNCGHSTLPMFLTSRTAFTATSPSLRVLDSSQLKPLHGSTLHILGSSSMTLPTKVRKDLISTSSQRQVHLSSSFSLAHFLWVREMAI